MTYLRVIPRDLFNEAKLLKCLGKLYLEAEKSGGARVNNEFQSRSRLETEHHRTFAVAAIRDHNLDDGACWKQAPERVGRGPR